MIIDSALFISCCQTAVLLSPVDQAFHAFAGPVDGSIRWPCPTLIPPPRDGDPDAVLPAIVPDRAAAVALVAHDAVGAALGAPPSRPPDGPLRHQERKDRGFMPVARRQDERHALAVAVRPHVDLGTEAPLTPAEGFRLGIAGGGARRMLMRSDNGAIHIMGVPIKLASTVGLLLHRRKEAGPDAGLAPAIKTARDRTPGAIAFRHITPRNASAQEPEDAVQNTAMVSGWTACFGLLRGK